MLKGAGFTIAVAILALTSGASLHTSRDSFDQQVSEVLAVSPGLSRADFIATAQSLATRTHSTLEKVVATAADEARGELVQSPGKRSSSGGGTVPLGDGRDSGDIFWDGNAFPAGHVGLYGGTRGIVEAPGLWQDSRFITVGGYQVHPDTRKITTIYSPNTQNRVADFAVHNLIGNPYNPEFWDNKGPVGWTTPINCSQLVWFAYRHVTGLDLDSDGGSGVYPSDIYYSKYTTEYERVR